MTPTLTIAIPTLGRIPGLKHTLDSIQRQTLIPGDRVLVVLDRFEQGSRPDIRALVDSYGSPFEYHEHDGGLHWYGMPQFNYAMTLASTDFFCGLGDDDVYVEGAFDRLRPQLEPGRAALVQFLSPPFPVGNGGRRFVFWDEPRLRVSHISGCCLIAPASYLEPVSLARRVETDYDWIAAVVANTQQPPIWIQDCLILARPDVRNGHTVRTLAEMQPTERALKVLLIDPGASTSTADVHAGLAYGLQSHGVQIVRYRLSDRIGRSHTWLFGAWRRAKKVTPTITRPTIADVFYEAGVGALAMALRHQVDAVLVVSAMLLHPDVIVLMKRAGLRVMVLFTESPYDVAQELKIARLVDGCWTNERTAVPAFRAVNPNSGYLPHAWHPDRHRPGPQPGDETVRAHDVVFVGTAFPERIAWLSAADWTGIDLGLYGNWAALGSRHPLRRYVAGAQVDNSTTARLYRRAQIGLNLYRGTVPAESLNPRAYELAACGVFHVSTERAELHDVFNGHVPTIAEPADASRVVRHWLADADGRRRIADQLPACVAESSWVERSAAVIGDLQTLLQRSAA